MAVNLKPLGDRVLVEASEEKETKKGGIIIPDSAKEKPMESVVVALGTGKTDDNGKKVPFEVKKGDRVLVSKYGGTEIKLDGEDVVRVEDFVFLAVNLDFRAAVFADEDAVTLFDFKRNFLAVVIGLARAERDDDAFLRFFLGGIGNDDAALFGFFFLGWFDQEPVAERFNV